MLTFSLLSSSAVAAAVVSGSATGAGVPSVPAGTPGSYDDSFKAIVIIMLTVITYLMYRHISYTPSNRPAGPTPTRTSGEGGGGDGVPPPVVVPGSWAPSAPPPADYPQASASSSDWCAGTDQPSRAGMDGAGFPSVFAGNRPQMDGGDDDDHRETLSTLQFARISAGFRRCRSAEVATQTEPLGVAFNYWDWKSQDIHAEARRRGLVPVHMKTNGIRQLIEDDLNSSNLIY